MPPSDKTQAGRNPDGLRRPTLGSAPIADPEATEFFSNRSRLVAFLKVVSGPNTGQIWELQASKSILGRHPDCNVPINTPDASRFHAQIERTEDNRFILEDLRSRNGTFLNDAVIRNAMPLGEGDKIRIAGVVLQFCQRALIEPPAGRGQRGRRTASADDFEVSPRRLPPQVVAALPMAGPAAPSCSNDSCRSQVTALLKIARSLRKAVALDTVLPQILDALLTIFPAADRGVIALRDAQGHIVPRWVKARDGGAHGRDSLSETRLSQTVVHHVMDSQEAVLSTDATHDPRFADSPSVMAEHLRSVMCGPLIDGEGKSFGILQIDSPETRHPFGDEDLEVFLSVAAQAAIAIDNAQLYEQMVRIRADERSLELAEQIQRSLLPQRPPELEGYEFFDYYQPAERTGGDFFDYIPLPDGRLAIMVADVVQRGIAAAMWTAKLAAEIRYRLLSIPDLPRAIGGLNASLVGQLHSDHFVTLVVAILDPVHDEITVVNAGHLPPLVRLPDGRIIDLGVQSSELPLGVKADTVYTSIVQPLVPGSVVLLYTNGVTEAVNAARQPYGLQRLRDELRGKAIGPIEIGQRLVDSLQEFLGTSFPTDDMCVLCFGRNPTGYFCRRSEMIAPRD